MIPPAQSGNQPSGRDIVSSDECEPCYLRVDILESGGVDRDVIDRLNKFLGWGERIVLMSPRASLDGVSGIQAEPDVVRVYGRREGENVGLSWARPKFIRPAACFIEADKHPPYCSHPRDPLNVKLSAQGFPHSPNTDGGWYMPLRSSR